MISFFLDLSSIIKFSQPSTIPENTTTLKFISINFVASKSIVFFEYNSSTANVFLNIALVELVIPNQFGLCKAT